MFTALVAGSLSMKTGSTPYLMGVLPVFLFPQIQ